MEVFEGKKTEKDLESGGSVLSFDTKPQKEEIEASNRTSLSSTSITSLMEKKSSVFIRLVMSSNVLIILTSLISGGFIIKSKNYLFFDKNFIAQQSGIFFVIGLSLFFLIHIMLITCNAFMFKFLKERREQICSVVQNTLRIFFPISNYLMSVLLILSIFSDINNPNILWLNILFSALEMGMLFFYYKKLKQKRQLDIENLITVSFYVSLLTLVSSYIFLFNIGEVIAIKQITGENRDRYVKYLYTAINVLQFFGGIYLLINFNDIIYILGTTLLIYTGEAFILPSDNTTHLLILIGLGYAISFWKVYNSGRAVFGLQKEEEDSNLIKLRNYSTERSDDGL